MYNAKSEGGLSVLANLNRDFPMKTLREERMDEQGDERQVIVIYIAHITVSGIR
jgi:hypothetical protein